MRSILFGSLQARLQVSTILVLFTGFTAASCASLVIDQRNFSEQRSKALHEQAETIWLCISRLATSNPIQTSRHAGEMVLPPITPERRGVLPMCLQGQREAQTVFLLRLADGELITPTPSSRFLPNGVIQALVEPLNIQSPTPVDLSLERNGVYYLLHRHKPSANGAQLIAVSNLSEQSRYMTTNLLLFMLLWLVLLVMTAFAVSLVVTRALAPLRELGALTDSMTAESLSNRRIKLQSAPTEVAALARSYDALLGRLSESWANQKQFVGAVSHELRNPLTLIAGYIRRTLRRAENLSDEQRRGLEIAMDETNRISRLIGQLLDLSRSDFGTLSVQLTPVRLVDELQEVDKLASSSLHRSLRLELSISTSDRGLSVMGNSDRIRQILMNLIENADKYSPSGVPITLALSRQQHAMVVRIEDRGIGIPEEDLPHVFDRFYRATNTSGIEGSGMGLAVTQVLVASMGATIAVTSTVGQGTTFELSFPLLEQDQFIPQLDPPQTVTAITPAPTPSA